MICLFGESRKGDYYFSLEIMVGPRVLRLVLCSMITVRVTQTRNVNANIQTHLPFNCCPTIACTFPRSRDHTSPSHEESWKPFLIDVDGGGGGGTPVPGLSGGRGGRGPLLGLSVPLLDGNWGVAGRARDVLPFLFIGGGGGRGPGAKEKWHLVLYLTLYITIIMVIIMQLLSACWIHALLLGNVEKWWRVPRRFSQEMIRRIKAQKCTNVHTYVEQLHIDS